MRIVRKTTATAYLDHVSFAEGIRPKEGTHVALELEYDYPADGFVTRVILIRTDDNTYKDIECDDCLPTGILPDGAIHIHAFDPGEGAPHEVYAQAAALLVAPHTTLAIASEGSTALFTLQIRSFQTHAGYPVGEVEDFFLVTGE
jgi:hypothetical protein